MGRQGEHLQCDLRKGAWTKEEDVLLRKCIERYGEGKWRQVPLRAGLRRCRKSCRLRWLNYLSPSIKRGEFSEAEVELIIKLHRLLGNRWSLIAGRIPGRTANDIKNFWNSHLSKKLASNCNEEGGKSKQQEHVVVIKPKARAVSFIHSSWFRDQPMMRPKVCSVGNDNNIALVPQEMNNNISASCIRHETQLEDDSTSWWENLLAEVEKRGGGDSASSAGAEPVGMRKEVNGFNNIGVGGKWEDWLLDLDIVS